MRHMAIMNNHFLYWKAEGCVVSVYGKPRADKADRTARLIEAMYQLTALNKTVVNVTKRNDFMFDVTWDSPERTCRFATNLLEAMSRSLVR